VSGEREDRIPSGVEGLDALGRVDLERVRRVINPPERIVDFEHLSQLIHDPDCHTVVEGKFYDEMVRFMGELATNRVPGDILVAGVWKGGSSLYLQALNRAFHLGKRVWLCDTFRGFIDEDITHRKDQEALRIFAEDLRFSVALPTAGDVERLFRRCHLWGDDVHILEGRLEEMLADRRWKQLSLIHIDVDFYEPTLAALELTYDSLSVGGYVVIDDYGVEMFNCADAVDDFRAAHRISEPLQRMTDYIAYWRRDSGA
jgi:hypothetical protein